MKEAQPVGSFPPALLPFSRSPPPRLLTTIFDARLYAYDSFAPRDSIRLQKRKNENNIEIPNKKIIPNISK